MADSDTNLPKPVRRSESVAWVGLFLILGLEAVLGTLFAMTEPGHAGSNPVHPRHQLRLSNGGTEPNTCRHNHTRAATGASRRRSANSASRSRSTSSCSPTGTSRRRSHRAAAGRAFTASWEVRRAARTKGSTMSKTRGRRTWR